MVGDNQGNVYTSKEGYGKAFILPKSEAISQLPDMIDTALNLELEQQKMAAKEKAVKDKTFQQQLLGAQPEWWTKHDTELRSEVGRLNNIAAEIYASGTDPFTSTDPTSVDFRKQLDRATSMGKLSLQWKDMYEKDRQKINSEQGKEFDPNSVVEWGDWFDKTTLNEALDKGLLPPTLRFKEPQVNLEKLARESAGGIAKEGQPTMGDYFTIAGGHLSDPTAMNQANQYLNDVKQKDPDYYTAMIETPAKAAGVSPQVYYMGTLIESYRPDKPLEQRVRTIIDNIKVGTYSKKSTSENTSGVTTTSELKETPLQTALSRGFMAANQNPQVVDDLVSTGATYFELERDKNGALVPKGEEKKVVDRKSAGEYLGYMIWSEQDYAKNASTTRKFFDEAIKSGKGTEEELTKDRDFYEKALRGKIKTWEELASYGVQVKGKSGVIPDEDRRRLQDWMANQAAGHSLPGEEAQIVGNFEEVVKDPTTGEPTGEKIQRSTSATLSHPDKIYKDQTIPGYISFAKKKQVFDQENQQFVTGYDYTDYSLDEGGNNYLDSGAVDKLYWDRLKGNKDQAGKQLIYKSLNEDLYEVFPDQNTSSAIDVGSGINFKKSNSSSEIKY